MSRLLTTFAVSFNVDRLNLIEVDHPVVLTSGSTRGSDSDVLGDILYEYEPSQYHCSDEDDDWDFADVPFDSHINTRVRIHLELVIFSESWRLDIVAVLEDWNGVLSQALQDERCCRAQFCGGWQICVAGAY